MALRQKSLWIFAALLLLIAAGIVIAYFTQDTQKNFHKGTFVYEREYVETAQVMDDFMGKVQNEDYTPVYKD